MRLNTIVCIFAGKNSPETAENGKGGHKTHVMNSQEYIEVSIRIEPYSDENAEILMAELEELPRQYANKRGRKAVQRDCGDLLVAYNNGIDLEAHLQENGYLEADYHG